ncbi:MULTISPECIES: hypothetical protein [unclassified Mesorhizobium]|uniref:hypothetical protein n=1 Tax=unclassified Mesorhizobium TaxID=325217 RepID=UPI00112D7E3C|nr:MULTISPECIES: hypothetical protein [unclassified Mesorhizobium]TPJ70447.1 hypothetical protein FJ462_07055 [Mesorhizobium sp. B2-6-7]TPJ76898.1 hypothetical protein FJ422_29770 [Mesorhizobium sp. B2-6-3]
MDIPEDIAKAALTYVGEPVAGDGLTTRDVIATYVARAIMAEREQCAKIAEMFIIEENSIHPDIPFDKISQQAKNIAHTTCQHVADAIRQQKPR